MASIAANLAKDRSKTLGVGTNKNPVKYLNQDYEELRAQCLASGILFEDPKFPACQSSLGVKDLGPNSEKVQGLVWKRPSEINPNPQFINEGVNRADVRQGSLGDCWFLCSIASLTLNEVCLYRVVPVDQSFTKSYAGIFHFKFWQYGEWVDVVVDDRLPTKKGKLVFVKYTAGNEFWSALLEKSYAKLNGSYEALKGGQSLEALEDFTGGVGEFYYCKSAPENIFQIIQKALRARSLLASSTKSDTGVGEIVVSTNVVKNHAYSLTGAEEVAYCGGTVQIVRVRNPWGYKEWNGAWSDNAPEWNEIDPKVKAELNFKCDDGETWMPISSFLVEFYRVDICHLNLDTVRCDNKHKWCLTEFKGNWTAGCTAGGRKSNPTFWTNPQFRITLEDLDDDHTGDTDAPCCTVVVSLMQKERRKKKPQGEELFSIGYYIYKIPNQTSTEFQTGKDFFKKNKEVARLDTYKNHREVSNRFQLPAGKYLIVPTTFNSSQEADFCLRVFTEAKAESLEFGNVVDVNLYEPLANSAPDTENQNAFEDQKEEKDEFNVEELKNVLNKRLLQRPDVKSNGFTLRTCREMVNLLDNIQVDNTGTLSNGEFNILWMKLENYMTLQHMFKFLVKQKFPTEPRRDVLLDFTGKIFDKKIFLEVDTNLTGTIDAHEMRNALLKAGFNLNNRIQDVIVQRFVSKELSIHFEDFIACMMRLETLLKMFHLLDTDKSGSISLSVSENSRRQWTYPAESFVVERSRPTPEFISARIFRSITG